MYLIDTDIISQLARRKPNAGVIQFFADIEQSETSVFLSAITIGELHKGITKLVRQGDKQQAGRLEAWFQNIKTNFANSILSFDEQAAEIWGELLAITDETNAVDKQIAATCLLYDLTIVTRNTRHMAPTGAKHLNPYIED